MTAETEDDVQALRTVGAVVAEAREAMLAAVQPGVSTGELDAIARDIFRKYGARSAPQLAYSFPGATCISVNHEAAHGIPSKTRFLRSGDLVNVDVSAELDGYWADTGASTSVGEVSDIASRLLESTRLAQRDAMAAAKAGSALRQVARAVQRRAREGGFNVVENLFGHGVGRHIHEPPDVASVEGPSSRTMLWEGAVLAIEPFLSVGGTQAIDADDGWTLLTNNGGLVAQFEHTIIVTKGEPIVVTATASAN